MSHRLFVGEVLGENVAAVIIAPLPTNGARCSRSPEPGAGVAPRRQPRSSNRRRMALAMGAECTKPPPAPLRPICRRLPSSATVPRAADVTMSPTVGAAPKRTPTRSLGMHPCPTEKSFDGVVTTRPDGAYHISTGRRQPRYTALMPAGFSPDEIAEWLHAPAQRWTARDGSARVGPSTAVDPDIDKWVVFVTLPTATAATAAGGLVSGPPKSRGTETGAIIDGLMAALWDHAHPRPDDADADDDRCRRQKSLHAARAAQRYCQSQCSRPAAPPSARPRPCDLPYGTCSGSIPPAVDRLAPTALARLACGANGRGNRHRPAGRPRRFHAYTAPALFCLLGRIVRGRRSRFSVAVERFVRSRAFARVAERLGQADDLARSRVHGSPSVCSLLLERAQKNAVGPSSDVPNKVVAAVPSPRP